MSVIRRIHQIVPRVGYADAVGNQIRECQRLLREWGYESDIFADSWDEPLDGQIRPTAEYRDGQPGTLALLHYCICGAANDFAFQLADPIAVYYHNVTPARFFSLHDRGFANCLAEARAGLDRFARRGPAIAASPFNQLELEGLGFTVAGQAPYVLWLDDLHEGVKSLAAERLRLELGRKDLATWLYVGRMAPNKRIEDVLFGFAEYQSRYNAHSRLLLVGSQHGSPGYGEMLQQIIAEAGIGESVVMPGSYGANSGLGVFYELADLYVCMSEHEGFCVPLVEAMSFDVPVLAYKSTGVPLTLGGSGVLVTDKSPRLVAAAAHEILRDPALARSITRYQHTRLAVYAPETARSQIRTAIERVVSYHEGR